MECYYSEEQVKTILNENLRSNGYTTKVAWNHAHGVDIEAKKGNRTLLIEVKGCGSRQQMRVNYFLSILGEMLQRMESENCEYFIALPDLSQYRKLWNKLPTLAKQRTTIKLILVGENNNIEILD